MTAPVDPIVTSVAGPAEWSKWWSRPPSPLSAIPPATVCATAPAATGVHHPRRPAGKQYGRCRLAHPEEGCARRRALDREVLSLGDRPVNFHNKLYITTVFACRKASAFSGRRKRRAPRPVDRKVGRPRRFRVPAPRNDKPQPVVASEAKQSRAAWAATGRSAHAAGSKAFAFGDVAQFRVTMNVCPIAIMGCAAGGASSRRAWESGHPGAFADRCPNHIYRS